MTALFLASLLLVAVLGAIAIKTPASTRTRTLALALVVLVIPLCYLSLGELQGRPKPITHEWAHANDTAVVLGVNFREGEAIYLWLRLDSSLEPRYYVMPWRKQAAEKLENTLEEAVRSNAAVVLKKPFYKKGFDDFGDLNVHIVRPPSPPKKLPRIPPRVYNPRSDEI